MKFLIVAVIISASLAFAACGSSNGGPQVAAVPPAGTGPMGTGVNPAACQVGQIYTYDYGCLNQGTCQTGYGYIPATQKCAQGNVVSTQTIYGTMGSAGRFYGTMQVLNATQFALLLKYAGLCDPYWVGYNFGSWNCDNWAQTGFIQLQYFAGNSTTNSNATMYIGAGSGYGGNYSYLQMTSGYIGFSQQARLSDGNNSAGMYIDGVGWNGQSVGLKLVIANGSLTANPSLSGFSADVFYQNVKFATVNFQRY